MRRSLQRLAMVVLLLLAVSMLTFVAMNVLGDPLFNILGPIAGDTENPESIAKIEAAKAQYYLDKPLPERYVRWLGDFVQGDMGVRFASDGQPPVTGLIKERLPRSLVLMGMAQAMALLIAIPWGISSAAGSLGGVDTGPRSWRFLVPFALKATAVTYFAQSLFGSVVGVVMLSWFIALLLAHQFAETVPAARALVDGVNKTMSGFSSALSFGFISMPNFALAVSLYYVFALKQGWFPLRYDASDGFFYSHVATVLAGAHACLAGLGGVSTPAADRLDHHIAGRLHPYGPSQGCKQASSPVPTRAATVDVLGDHRVWYQCRCPCWWSIGGRDILWYSGHRYCGCRSHLA